MRRLYQFLSVWSDLISVTSFLFWLLASFPIVSTQIMKFLSSLPFALRLVIVSIFEIAVAYTLGAFVKRLVQNEGQSLNNLPSKLALVFVISLLLALASIYNTARILFLDQFSIIGGYIPLLFLQVFLLWLRGVFLRSNLNSVRKFAHEILIVQRIFASGTGIVFFAFLIERSLLG